jgi:hypothetical protein
MDGEKNNLVSLANKAHMLSRSYDWKKAQDVLKCLSETKQSPDFDYLLVRVFST